MLTVPQLLLKAAALLFGIVQLAEAVGDFHLAGIDFPALRPVWLVGFLLGKRGDGGRELIDDCGLNQMFFCRSEEHTSELQSHVNLVCRLLLEKKKKKKKTNYIMKKKKKKKDENKYKVKT